MRYLLVKEKNKKSYNLYCPDTYGVETWGSSSSQIGLKKKRKTWSIETWCYGGEWSEDEITETIEHILDKCPHYNGKLEEENIVMSDIIDIKVNIIRQRNNIHNYKCL